MVCNSCPRRCGAERGDFTPGGVCGSPALPRIARATPHFGEEPCISGVRGSGTVFFSGCNLRCVFCQNREISRGEGGLSVSVPRLREIMLRLRDEGVSCIDLVTGTHYTPTIAEALSGLSLGIPVVWNSSGYESVETLRQLTADEFTRETGIEVNFSIMPDEKKITLANSTGSNPDLALGLSYYRWNWPA